MLSAGTARNLIGSGIDSAASRHSERHFRLHSSLREQRLTISPSLHSFHSDFAPWIISLRATGQRDKRQKGAAGREGPALFLSVLVSRSERMEHETAERVKGTVTFL